ncbi:hypothetical protein pipiens_018156 [Culex pipiens pipiens]|uniref:Sine oculis-binding protein n=1 Tax=Culex pipiens pipiens TaxID=38569 RepID=A0ABD1CD79_CULPP
MNDILGWYGYGDSVDRIDIASSSSTAAPAADSTHHPRHKESNSSSSSTLKSKHNNKPQQHKPSRQFNMLQHQQQQQHNSGDSDSIVAVAASGVVSPPVATVPSKAAGVLVSPGSNSSSNINNSSSTATAEARSNGVNLHEQQREREHGQGAGESSTSEKDSSRESSKSPMLVKMLEKQEPICGWCRRGVPPNQTGCIAGTTEGIIFCSESCFSQSRRASFKRAKTCDWCRHVRHAVSYVDFQDGVTQLQFCSDKCLNQYKMQIFCNETQAHLDMNPHLKEKSTSAGSLITPDLWLKNCKSRSASPLSDRSESVSPAPSLPMRPSPEPSPVMQSPPAKKPMISVAHPSKLLSKNLQPSTAVNARSVIKSTRKRRPGLRPLQQNTLHNRRAAKVDYGQLTPNNNNNNASVLNNNLPASSMPKPATVTSANIQDLRTGISLQNLTHSLTPTKFESRESPTTPRPPPLNIPPQFLQLPPNPAMRPPFFPLNPAFRFGSPPNPQSMPPPPPPNMDPNNPQNRHQPPLLGFPAPPVTILVPYPIVIPLPLPIPIPIPLIDFLKATAPKEEAKPEPTTSESPVSTTEQPARTLIEDDSVSDPELEERDSPLDFTVPQNRPPQQSYSLEPVQEPATEPEADHSPEQRLPKFRITRLSGGSSSCGKRVEMESEEEPPKEEDEEDRVERSRPLRKRKRLVGHQEETTAAAAPPIEGGRRVEEEGTKG